MSPAGENQIRRATRWMLAARIWSVICAPASLLAVAHGLDPARQGYYYAFSALIAASALVELGLGQVIITISSHLREGTPTGSGGTHGEVAGPGRLGWLLRRSTTWMLACAPLFFLTVGGLGIWMLSGRDPGIAWAGPWFALLALAAIDLPTVPTVALIEGSGRIVAIARLRFAQAILPTLALWAGLWGGAGLWSPCFASATGLALTLGFILIHRRSLGGLWMQRPPDDARWSREVWPLQWRYGLSWLCGWLLSQSLVPLVLRFDGPVAAGQLGMSLGLAWALIAVGSVWINAAVPELGRLAAARDWPAMDGLWRRAARNGLMVTLAGGVAALACVLALSSIRPDLASRLLPPQLLAWTLGFSVIHVATSSIAAHLRAHRAEPLLALSLSEGACMITLTATAALAGGIGLVVATQALVHLVIGLGGTLAVRKRFLARTRA